MARMIVLALTALAIAGTAAPSALADTRASGVKVSYADLDLGSADGARTMLSRIRAASEQACVDPHNNLSMENRWERLCIKRSMANAVAELNAPMVLAMFAEPKNVRMASR